MYVGQYEERRADDPHYAKIYDMVSDTKNLESKLRSRHYTSLRLSVEVLNEEDHLTVAPRGFTRGLSYLLPEPEGVSDRK